MLRVGEVVGGAARWAVAVGDVNDDAVDCTRLGGPLEVPRLDEARRARVFRRRGEGPAVRLTLRGRATFLERAVDAVILDALLHGLGRHFAEAIVVGEARTGRRRGRRGRGVAIPVAIRLAVAVARRGTGGWRGDALRPGPREVSRPFQFLGFPTAVAVAVLPAALRAQRHRAPI